MGSSLQIGVRVSSEADVRLCWKTAFRSGGAGVATNSAPLKVLVVDDEPEVEAMFRQRLRRDLRSGRYDMVFALSGVHALEVLDEHPDVKVVVTDLNMPRMDGMALLSALQERWPSVQPVVLSAYGDAQRVEDAKARGARAFMVKPVDFDAVRELLETCYVESTG